MSEQLPATRGHQRRTTKALAAIALVSLLVATGCSTGSATQDSDPDASADTEPSASADTTADAAQDTATGTTAVGLTCEEIAALFVTSGSANADLADPEVSASCDGDDVVITSNGIPDYTYIETSPGSPAAVTTPSPFLRRRRWPTR